MNPDLVLELATVVLSVTKRELAGAPQEDAILADILLQIVEKGVQAMYQEQGKVLDPALIKPEATL